MRAAALLLLLCAAVAAVSAGRPQPEPEHDYCYYKVNLQRGWYSFVPGNMRPLQCPAGFRNATAQDAPLLQASLEAEFSRKAWPQLEESSKWGCNSGRIHSKNYTYLNGCVQTWPKGVPPTVMAQGKLTYVCKPSGKAEPKHHTLGLDGEGTFKAYCL